ncbi:DNA-processing protein DprA [Deinococcus sp.]|uniref:DNA-processing protein DprA n=1 Tax=Deinococcus sp. TaxID=47478 RepID=UPI003C7A278A
MTAVHSSELLALLTLRLTPGLGPRRVEALRRFCGSAQAVLSAHLTELREVSGMDQKSLAAIGTPEPERRAMQQLQHAADYGATLLGRGLEGYPEALEALDDPPAVIWVAGELPPLTTVPQAIGVVGTRKASTYALHLTARISADLARAGVVVVSGLARGIDTAAHRAAVDAGGVSIGILGSGLDQMYPAENLGLSRRLTVISEYPLGTPPAAHNFPMRNRLIAALSAGSLIVEGELKSGAMITATHALECGRTVFAVPGRATDPLASGPHRLLREGAVLTESAGDILQELGWREADAASTPELPPEQARVWELLAEPATLDDLQFRAGLPHEQLQMALMLLQLGGHIDDVGGRYLRR